MAGATAVLFGGIPAAFTWIAGVSPPVIAAAALAGGALGAVLGWKSDLTPLPPGPPPDPDKQLYWKMP